MSISKAVKGITVVFKDGTTEDMFPKTPFVLQFGFGLKYKIEDGWNVGNENGRRIAMLIESKSDEEVEIIRDHIASQLKTLLDT